MRDQPSAGQFSLFDVLAAPTPAVKKGPPLSRLPFADPGPLTGKMAGKSARKVASTRPYHASEGAFRAVEPRAPAPRGPRYGNVTETGPHRYFIRSTAVDAGRRELVDRESGEVIDSGPWLNMWGLALRMNGIDAFAREAVDA